jgi:hypothetical protein
MSEGRINAFVEYVVPGLLQDRRSKGKPFLSVGRGALTHILGGQRLGSAQKEELREACKKHDIGLAERADQFLFFDWDDVLDLTINATSHKDDLKKHTDHFAKMHRRAADEEWEDFKFAKLG